MIGTLLFTAGGVALAILIIWLAQNGPGRVLVRVLFWVANHAGAIARGADEYVAGYHTHLDLFRLDPNLKPDFARRPPPGSGCTNPAEEDTLVALYKRKLR